MAGVAHVAVAVAVSLALSAAPPARSLPPPSSDPGRCDRAQLSKFRATRASFSMEVGSGALPEAVLDLRACDFHDADLREEVLSGAVLDGADFSGAQMTKVDASRATARGANFAGARLVDANLFEVAFDGADLRGAVFSNAVLSSASFKKALLQGCDFEGALLSSSDARELCTNASLDDDARAVLGCSTLPQGAAETATHVASVGVAPHHASVASQQLQQQGQAAVVLPSSGLALALLGAALTSVCTTVTVFLLAMWPTLKATERASLATEAAMRAMEEASAATTKASRELEVLMLRTQAELPATLAAVEEASVQWDRLGLEIRDSGRRFGLTNPGATAGALAASRAGAGRAAAAAAGATGTPALMAAVSPDPLLMVIQEGGAATPAAGGGGVADLSEQLAVATGMLPGAETVSAAVGRFVEEATQAGAAALANGAVAAAGGMAGADADVLESSLQALRTWRARLNRVLDATREVVAGAATSVDATTAAGAANATLAKAKPEGASPSTAQARQLPASSPLTRRDGSDGVKRGDAAAVVAPTTAQQVAPKAEQVSPVAALATGALTWLGAGLRRVPGALVGGAAVAGAAVGGALAGVKVPGLRRPSDPLPATADEDEARAERAKAIALALALAEEAAEEARAATGALGRLFNQTAAAITASPGRGAADALPQGAALGEGGGVAAASAAATDGGGAPSLALADEAAALAAAKAAEAAMQEASRASTALLGALAESRAAGDAIEPAVLAALEELPAKVFDDDSYTYSSINDDDGDAAAAADTA